MQRSSLFKSSPKYTLNVLVTSKAERIDNITLSTFVPQIIIVHKLLEIIRNKEKL